MSTRTPLKSSVELVNRNNKALSRVYPPRKNYLSKLYNSLLPNEHNNFNTLLVFQYSNLSVEELSNLRRKIQVIRPPNDQSGANLTITRTGVLSGILKRNDSVEIRKLNNLMCGPTAVITLPTLDPMYLSEILKVIDSIKPRNNQLKSFRSVPKSYNPPYPSAQPNILPSNPRMFLLGGILEQKAFDAITIKSIANLPTLPQIQSQLTSLISQPAQQLSQTLSMASGQKLALTLDSYKQQKEKNE